MLQRWLLVGMVLVLTGCELLAPTPILVTPTPEAVAGDEAFVVNIIDGDTVDVLLDGQTYRVRYIGINTPERDEACYRDAAAANAALVEGQSVTLVKDVSETDRFGRLLRYIYVDGLFVNASLVRDGWAESVHYPPDTAHASEFDVLEDAARAANIGCHPTGVFDN